MNLKAWLKPMIDENVRLITTDHDLQKFMVGAFSLLATIMLYCTYLGDFAQAETYYHAADMMLSGYFDYRELGIDLSPLTTLLLIPPRLFSPNPTVFCYLFSLYGFAFYMLGGHFMLKSCRETGFSQRSAYILLFLFFISAFSGMTLSTGPIAVAFVIMSLWFYHIRKYSVSLMILALAVMSGFFPILLLIIYLIDLGKRKELSQARYGILAFIAVCAVLLVIPMNYGLNMTEYAPSLSLMGVLNSWFGVAVHTPVLIAGALIVALGLIIPAAFNIPHERPDMRSSALILELGLIILCILCPIDGMVGFIWIVMLFPMTQMTGKPYSGQRETYAVLSVLCILTFLAHSELVPSGIPSELVTIMIAATMVILAVNLFKEYKILRN